LWIVQITKRPAAGLPNPIRPSPAGFAGNFERPALRALNLPGQSLEGGTCSPINARRMSLVVTIPSNSPSLAVTSSEWNPPEMNSRAACRRCTVGRTVSMFLVITSAMRVTVRARFPNPEGLLLPGMYVRAEFAPVQMRAGILAPQQGISRDVKGNATAMVIAEDSTVQLRQVVADRTVGDRWLVSSGLVAGDKLVIEGLGRIKPGQKVKPVPVGDAAASAAAAPMGAVAN